MNWLDGNAPEDVKEGVIKGDLSVKAAYTFVKLCKDYELTEEQQQEAAKNIMESKNFGEKQMISVIQDILYPPSPDSEEEGSDTEEGVHTFDAAEYFDTMRGHSLRLRKDLINLEKLTEEVDIQVFHKSVEFALFLKEIGKLDRKIKNFYRTEDTSESQFFRSVSTYGFWVGDFLETIVRGDRQPKTKEDRQYYEGLHTALQRVMRLCNELGIDAEAIPEHMSMTTDETE